MNYYLSIEQFLERCALSGVAGPLTRKGCTEEEILRLEKKYQVQLPNTYRRFLAEMGKDSGYLFAHDHTNASYKTAWHWSAVISKELVEEFPDQYPKTPEFPPAGYLINANRLVGANWLIKCQDQEDSPVWYVYVCDGLTLEKVADSFVDWLDSWRVEAELVIESGFFDK